MRKYMTALPWLQVFADPPVVTQDPPVVVDPPVTGDPPPPPDPDFEKPTMSKKMVNEIVEKRLAQQKRQHDDEKKKVIDQLENARKAQGLTSAEKEKLATQIEELRNSMLTKEQQSELAKKKLETELTSRIKESDAKAEKNWNLYQDATIKRSITDAATTNEAFRPKQIVTVLEKLTHLVEDKDGDGNGLGTYTPRVKFPDVKEGKPVTLDLTVDEAVRRMKDLPDEYGNLFKSGVSGGLGGSSGSGGGGGNDATAPTDPAKYRQWRERQRKAGAL